MGARLLRRWIQQPLLDLEAIHDRLDAVAELNPPVPEEGQEPGQPRPRAFLRADLRRLLGGLYDMERLVGRIGFGAANARDLAALRRTLKQIPLIKRRLEAAHSARLTALNGHLDALHDVAALIGEALVDDPPILLREGGLIRAGYHEELGRLRRSAAEGRDWLAGYEARERERTGIPNLRVRYNQVFGFFVEVPRSKSGEVPPEYERRATISHAERFVTPELRVREADILAAEERANELEYELFVQLRGQVAAHTERLQRSARVLAELDVLAALAETAARHGYTRPLVDASLAIEIEEGRHPVVEQTMPGGVRFIPNDTALDGDGRRWLLVLTGPNMSGKSVYIRQVALIALMAHMGSFVPARRARVGLVDRIFVRAGASDDIAQGRSTFLVEMNETASILRQASPRSLVVLDEVGRGTSTYDGMALAWAVGEDLHDRVGARTLFATHFHELTALADELQGARNASLAVKEEGHEVVFLYRLVDQGADRSYGVQVARLAGVPEHVVERARQVMARLEAAGQPRSYQTSELINTSEVSVQEGASLYTAQPRPVPVDDEVMWMVARRLFALDIANLTPVQALVVLNELQQVLRGRD
jgi:DNA mismatch repair protein MutS